MIVDTNKSTKQRRTDIRLLSQQDVDANINQGLFDSSTGPRLSAAVNTPSTKSKSAPPIKGTITRIRSKRTRPATAAELLAAEGIDLPQVMSDLQQISPVNASRVVKLHDRIAAGEYKIDAESIATKMLNFERTDNN